MRNRIALPLAALILYSSTVCLNSYFMHNIVKSKEEMDIIERMFGGVRVFIGDWAFMKAEEYHHRGLPFEQALEYHKDESPFANEEHHEEEGKGVKKDFFSVIYSAVKVTGDSHLKPSEEKEVLPWFYVETAFNPHDIRGYTLGAYWLQRLGKFDESLKFLETGYKNNPGSAEILASTGNLYYNHNEVARGVPYLERARLLWIKGGPLNTPTSQYEKNDVYFALDILADSYVKLGDYRQAIKAYEELYGMRKDAHILKKIDALKNRTVGK